MKLMLMPTATEQDWWVLTHDLTLVDGRFRRLRPIHMLTFLAHFLVQPERNHFVHSVAWALENKIAAVGINHVRVRAAWSKCGDAGRPSQARVKPYDAEQEVIAAIDAFLHSIYTVLETTAFLNRQLHSTSKLKQHFRDQATKVAPFSMESHPWLLTFYDLRTQLTHLVSLMPIIGEQKFIIEFTHANRLLVHDTGRHEVALVPMLSFYPALLDMLDEWAGTELPRLDRDVKVDCFRETSRGGALDHVPTPIGDILALLNG